MSTSIWDSSSQGPRLPAIFFGHGNPMNALEKNPWTERWRRLGERIPRPRAILCVSAHWYVPALAVTSATSPATIHDFGGFPRALHEVQYASAGSPELARRVAQLLGPAEVSQDADWGLDHGTWSVLAHVFPQADIPVVQLSLDSRRPPRWHFETAKRLAPLRDEGVLIVGSGFMTHGLPFIGEYFAGKPGAPQWSKDFDLWAAEALASGDLDTLFAFREKAPGMPFAHPTVEHFAPLFVTLGAAAKPDDAPRTAIEGFFIGLSKRSIETR